MRSRYAQQHPMEVGSGSIGCGPVESEAPPQPTTLEEELNQAQINMTRAEDTLQALIKSIEMNPGKDASARASFAGIMGTARNLNDYSERLCDGINYLASLILSPKPVQTVSRG